SWSGGGIGNGSSSRMVIYGWWRLMDDGRWTFHAQDGYQYKDEWVYAYNPYADPKLGQKTVGWFHLDKDGYLTTGSFTDKDGKVYYLNEVSDNTLGMMLTGWQLIKGKWYYFNPTTRGTEGMMLSGWFTDPASSLIYYLDPNGGYMHTGTTVIDGISYQFTENASMGQPEGSLKK
ncbi:MAG: hypothetical protein Q4B67_05700, partial [Eubacteriales bacterium]|nr:hypothetical protein [Eubacteriales bacterium]